MVSASDIRAERLGSAAFRRAHGVRLAYAAGSMFKGIASEAFVVRMARAQLLSFFGAGGLSLSRVDEGIARIQSQLDPGARFGVNVLCNTLRPEMEQETVAVLLARGVELIEASAFTHVTPAVARFRFAGLDRRLASGDGPRAVQAKVSRPEVAEKFLSPPPEKVLRALVEGEYLTARDAEFAARFPMADDVCVEADSGGHTDNGVASALFPAMLRTRDSVAETFPPAMAVRIGAAGGIGTPEAVASTFIMGADFVLTGSINQCTVEAGTSDMVKDLLAKARVQDMEMAPAGDMFEVGAKVQVLKKGLFFPMRANKLYELYRRYDSLEAIAPETRGELERRYFGRPLEVVQQETREYLSRTTPEEVERFDTNPKIRMARTFQWYFGMSSRVAQAGDAAQKLNFQINCGPALGACNAWLAGTHLESWRARHPDELAHALMEGAAKLLGDRLYGLVGELAPVQAATSPFPQNGARR